MHILGHKMIHLVWVDGSDSKDGMSNLPRMAFALELR